MNSKRVKVGQLQQIAASLGLLTTGTAVVTRQLIERKLVKMDREPRNTQIAIEDRSEKSATF